MNGFWRAAGWRGLGRAGGLVGLLLSLQACQPATDPIPHPPQRVLLLSQLQPEWDEPVLKALDAALARAGLGREQVGVERVQVDASHGDAPFQAQVAQAVAAASPTVVLTTTSNVAQAVLRAQPTQPVVFRSAPHPVAACLVNSLLKPGRPVTGYTSHLLYEARMAAALVEAYPGLRTLVVLVDGEEGLTGSTVCEPDPDPDAPADLGVDPSLGSPACLPGPIQPGPDLDRYFAPAYVVRIQAQAQRPVRWWRLCTEADFHALTRQATVWGDTGLLVPYHTLFNQHRQALVQALNRSGRPAVYASRSFVAEGGLMAVGPIPERLQEGRGVDAVVRILRGGDPATMAVEQPEGYTVHVNVGTAARLKLPPTTTVLRTAEHLLR